MRMHALAHCVIDAIVGKVRGQFEVERRRKNPRDIKFNLCVGPILQLQIGFSLVSLLLKLMRIFFHFKSIGWLSLKSELTLIYFERFRIIQRVTYLIIMLIFAVVINLICWMMIIDLRFTLCPFTFKWLIYFMRCGRFNSFVFVVFSWEERKNHILWRICMQFA